jgi:inosine-uridine nucleoside N-ribohydrolase
VLLDTDIGLAGDIDDAMCLAYLLAQPACDLLGITTVSWDTEQKAMVASALCRAAGRRVPILPGAETPLLAPLPSVAQPETPGGGDPLLSRWDHDQVFPRGEAVEFMRRTVRRQPGEVVLLAIGPLTNVALLFAVDPEIPGLLKRLVTMSGMFAQPGTAAREWNALVDPHATAMVYRAAARAHRSVGLEITCEVTLEAREARLRLRGPRWPLLRELTEAWFGKTDHITFHDPLTAATIFDDSLCRFARGTVEVDPATGRTDWTAGGPASPHEIAIDADRKRFLDHYFSLVQ